MAAHFTTVITVARTGTRVVRYLIQPARKLPGSRVAGWGRDPWLLSAPDDGFTSRIQRGSHLARRGLGLGVLMLLSVLGASLLFVTLLLLGIALANGHTFAGWLMAFTLLLGVLGAVWTVRRAGQLLHAREEAAPNAPQSEEATLLGTLRTHERALPGSTRTAFHATVIATRDALRATSDDITLTREAFDVRQAAREELPELLDAYQSVPRTSRNDAELLRQLSLIEGRMQKVIHARRADQERALQASGRYLDDKYGKKDG